MTPGFDRGFRIGMGLSHALAGLVLVVLAGVLGDHRLPVLVIFSIWGVVIHLMGVAVLQQTLDRS